MAEKQIETKATEFDTFVQGFKKSGSTGLRGCVFKLLDRMRAENKGKIAARNVLVNLSVGHKETQGFKASYQDADWYRRHSMYVGQWIGSRKLEVVETEDREIQGKMTKTIKKVKF